MVLIILTCLGELLFLLSCLSLSRLESCSGGIFQQHVWTGLPRQCRSAAGRAVSWRPQTCPGAPVQPGGEGQSQSAAAYRNSTGSHWVATGWRCEYMASQISFKIFCLIHRLQMIFALYCVPKSNCSINNWKCHPLCMYFISGCIRISPCGDYWGLYNKQSRELNFNVTNTSTLCIFYSF